MFYKRLGSKDYSKEGEKEGKFGNTWSSIAHRDIKTCLILMRIINFHSNRSSKFFHRLFTGSRNKPPFKEKNLRMRRGTFNNRKWKRFFPFFFLFEIKNRFERNKIFKRIRVEFFFWQFFLISNEIQECKVFFFFSILEMKESCKNIDLKRKKDRDIQCIRKKKKKDFQSTRDFYYFEKRILCRKRFVIKR